MQGISTVLAVMFTIDEWITKATESYLTGMTHYVQVRAGALLTLVLFFLISPY